MPLKRLYWVNSEKNAAGYVNELPVYADLRANGVEVVPIVWDRDPLPALERGEHLIVRTPWDYLEKLPRFQDWLRALPEERIHNAAKILRWNSEKTYLRELERAGVRLVPTRWMDCRTEEEVERFVRESFPGRERIVKPVLSAGSHHTYRLAAEESPPREVFVGRPAMVQPYLPEIETDGERSLIFFGGDFSHAVLKLPRPGDFRVQESFGGRFSAFEATAEERAFGSRVVDEVRRRFPAEPAPLYARIDYVRVEGLPHLMEAELLEPDLYFHHAPGAASRFSARMRAQLAE